MERKKCPNAPKMKKMPILRDFCSTFLGQNLGQVWGIWGKNRISNERKEKVKVAICNFLNKL